MLNPNETPFQAFRPFEATHPDAFLKRETVTRTIGGVVIQESLTYIEYLLCTSTSAVGMVPTILNHYASLIQRDDRTHPVALEKFTHYFCFHLLSLSLEDLNSIQKDPSAYFPHCKSEDDKIVLQELIKKGSIRVKVGALTHACGNLSRLNTPFIKEEITSLATAPLYTEHRTATYQIINTVMATTGWVMQQLPLLSYLNTTANRVAQAIDHPIEIQTERQRKLIGFSERITGITNTDISHLSILQKQSHVELLLIFYASANIVLQNDIATKLEQLIAIEKDNAPLMESILKNAAPRPLGHQWHAMQAPADILMELSIEANMALLKSVESLLNDTEKMIYQDIMNKFNKKYAFTVNLSWLDAEQGIEWLSYLLCMGHFPQISEVRITCYNPPKRQTLLLLYLMGNQKLVIASYNPLHFLKLSSLAAYTPQCCYEIMDCSANRFSAKAITQSALSNGLLSARIRLTDPPIDIITSILNDPSCFDGVPHGAVIEYSFCFSDEPLAKFIDLQLSAIRIMPNGNSLTNHRALSKLIDLILVTFSKDYEKALKQNILGNNIKVRPIAIPKSALADQTIREAITNHQHLQLFVYEEHRGKKVFLYDILCAPSGNDNSIIKAGAFSFTKDNIKAMKEDFPDVQIPMAVKEKLILSQNKSVGENSSPALLNNAT